MADNLANRIPPAERRAQIIACATDLFAERGFVLTTMDDVAEKSHITKRTLYRYFASKDELLFEIHDTFSGHAWAQTHLTGGDARDTFLALVREHVELVCAHTTEITVFFEQRRHLTPLRAMLVDQRRGLWQTYAATVIEAGTRSHRFRDLPALAVTQLVLGSLTELYRWYRPDGAYPPARLADLYSQLFLRGIATDRDAALPEIPEAPPSSSSPPGGVRNKDRVLEAATAAFAEHGYHATSIRHLADLAEVTQGAVMYHARYKNDLLAEIHRATFSDAIEAIEEATAACAGRSATVTLGAIVRAQVGFMAQRQDGIAVVNDNMRFLDPATRGPIDELRGRWLHAFTGTVERGVAEGDFAYADPALATRTLIGMLNSASRWYRPDGRLGPADLTRVLMDVLVTGIGCE